MVRDRFCELARALDDLSGGLRALLGFERSRPRFVRDLLQGGEIPVSATSAVAERGAGRRPARRRRLRTRPHLALVK